MSEASGSPVDIGTFWRTIGQRATGATIVAARGAAGPAGLLGLSATHVAASPPTMLVSVSHGTSALAAIREAGHFAISFLPAGAEALVDAFGGKGELKGADRFTIGSWTTLATGAPVLADALGALDCEIEEILDRHDTAIVLGRVVAVATADGDPLILFKGRPHR